MWLRKLFSWARCGANIWDAVLAVGFASCERCHRLAGSGGAAVALAEKQESDYTVFLPKINGVGLVNVRWRDFWLAEKSGQKFRWVGLRQFQGPDGGLGVRGSARGTLGHFWPR